MLMKRLGMSRVSIYIYIYIHIYDEMVMYSMYFEWITCSVEF